MKKLVFCIPPRKAYFHAKLLTIVFECYSSCIVMHVGMACIILEMMMSILQEMEGLTKELYFIILCRRKTSFHAKVYTVYLF